MRELPVIVFGVGGVIGMLAGGLGTGFAVAIFMANAGGSWDNAKKWIESGELGGKYLKNAAGDYVDANGNKVARKEDSKNPRHGATVIGDTVATRSRTRQVPRSTFSSSSSAWCRLPPSGSRWRSTTARGW